MIMMVMVAPWPQLTPHDLLSSILVIACLQGQRLWSQRNVPVFAWIVVLKIENQIKIYGMRLTSTLITHFKMSAGVASDVNLGNPLHAGNK